MPEERTPADVPDDDWPDDLLAFDTDGDGNLDTAVTSDGVDLILLTDLDGDGAADQVLRIGSDAVVRQRGPEPPESAGSAVVDGLLDGAAAGYAS